MPKTYSEAPDLRSLASQLVERYYFHLGHVDLDSIYFASIGGSKPKKAAVAEISGVSSAWLKQRQIESNGELYCLAVWDDAWGDISPDRQAWIVWKLLYSISPIGEGKIRKPDVQEYGVIIDTPGMGPYWDKRSEALPLLLDGDAPVPIPPPPDDTDEGSTLGDE